MGYWRLFYHIVWATKNRQCFITPDIEHDLHRHIAARATLAGGMVYSVNGMEDHVHLIAAVPPGKSLSSFIGTVKGSTSHLLNYARGIPFEWQDGYGVFSISPRGVDEAVEYVRGQKDHHRADHLIDALEYSSDKSDGPKRPTAVFE